MKGSTGDGPDCIITPAHGASYVLPGGRAWCPNQAHDKADPVEPGLIDRQQDWLDARAAKATSDAAQAPAQEAEAALAG